MKGNLRKGKYRCKKGCGCKLCKPQKGGWIDKKTIRDVKEAIKHEQELNDL